MTYEPVIKWEKFIHINDELQDQLVGKIKEHEKFNSYEDDGFTNFTIAPENNTYANHFNSWYIHLPCRLTSRLSTMISNVDGVEIFQPKTFYRGVITFGKSFYDSNETNQNNQVNHLKANVEKTITEYMSKQKEAYFVQVILPNDKLILESSNNKAEILSKMDDLKFLAEKVSGTFDTNVGE